MARKSRSETAFVADRRAHAAAVQDRLQGVECLSAVADRFAEGRSAERNDHEFLQIEVVIRVSAAVDHVHHRDGERHSARAAEVAVERKTGLFSRGAGNRHGNGENRVRAEAALVLRAIELNHRAVDVALIRRLNPEHRVRDVFVHVTDGLKHTLAAETLRILVAELDRFADAGRRAGRNRRAAHHAGLKPHIAFNGRVAAGIENLTADNIND